MHPVHHICQTTDNQLIPFFCFAGLCQFALVSNLKALDETMLPSTLYKSGKVDNYMKKLASDLKIQASNIFPVFTYEDKREISDEICAVVLHAFAEIVRSVETFLS